MKASFDLRGEGAQELPASRTEFLTSTWAAIETQGVRAVVLRNYGGLPERIEGDLDVLLHPDQMDETRRLILASAKRFGWRLLFQESVSNHCQLVFWCPRNGKAPARLHLPLDLPSQLPTPN